MIVLNYSWFCFGFVGDIQLIIRGYSRCRSYGHGRISCQVRNNSSKIDGRRGGLMVSALDSGASAPGSSPGLGHCVVFLGKTLYSHGASLHPGV